MRNKNKLILSKLLIIISYNVAITYGLLYGNFSPILFLFVNTLMLSFIAFWDYVMYEMTIEELLSEKYEKR